MNIDRIITNLNGIKKGDATSIAIMLLPSGNLDIKGSASCVYITSENGKSIIKNMSTKSKHFEILVFNS